MRSLGWVLIRYDCVLREGGNLAVDTHVGSTPCEMKANVGAVLPEAKETPDFQRTTGKEQTASPSLRGKQPAKTRSSSPSFQNSETCVSVA